jgi:L-ascorbate metabolism protein UlaG (beta-lactamase superfamily)
MLPGTIFSRKIQRGYRLLMAFTGVLAMVLTGCTPVSNTPSQPQITITPPASTQTKTTTNGNPVVTVGTAAAAAAPTIVPSANPIVSTPNANPITMSAARLQWLGQSTFVLTSSNGTKILMDPVNNTSGYNITPISGVDVITITHEHSDHNNVAMATGSPLILRGLNTNGWVNYDQSLKGVRIYSIGAYDVFHDNTSGSQRGRDSFFVFEVDGLRIAHLGDLGHTLTPEQINRIGPVDVLMIPVGGFYTIDAAAATIVVDQLKPKIVIPMHYKTTATANTSPLATADAFLAGKTVQRVNATTITVSKNTLPAQMTVMVPNFQ